MSTKIYHSPEMEITAIQQVQTLCSSEPTQPVSFSTIPGEGEGL